MFPFFKQIFIIKTFKLSRFVAKNMQKYPRSTEVYIKYIYSQKGGKGKSSVTAVQMTNDFLGDFLSLPVAAPGYEVKGQMAETNATGV